MKKIAIDASRANCAQKTGVEWYAFSVIEELKKIIPDDIEVLLYTREPLFGDLSVLPKNWKKKVLRWPPKILWTQIRLLFQLFRDKPDVFFVPAHVSPFFYRGKMCVTIHDAAYKYFSQCYSVWENWYQNFSVSYICRRAVKIFCPSAATRDDLKRFFSVDRSKIVVIPNGFSVRASENTINEEKEQVLKKYAIQLPYFLSVSRLELKKNTVRIIQAFNNFKAKQENQNYQLVLVGKPGYGYAEVLAEYEKSPYRSQIKMLGYVEECDLPFLYTFAKAFIFPSLYEGFGIPVLEAQSYGVPVITSNTSSLPQVAEEGAVLVDPYSVEEISSAMKEIIDNSQLARDLINKGKMNCQRFSWEKTAEKIWDEMEGIFRE